MPVDGRWDLTRRLKVFLFIYLHLLLSTRVLPPGYVTGYLQCVVFY